MRDLRSPFFDRMVLGGVIVGNAIAWAIPSNVAKLVAREQHVLLGRYSRAHFSWLVVAGILSLILLFLHFSPTPAVKKRRVFSVLAMFIGLIPSLFAVDLVLRAVTDYPYAPDEHVYHRPTKAVYRGSYEDLPKTKRSFPQTPPGYGTVELVMSYDTEGFRNARALAQCDIVAVGDSFTEGSRVRDEESWPARLMQQSGLSVCNLGISGYGPPEYVAAVERYGLPKKPKYVICMVYEGNDFRSARTAVRAGVTLKQAVATSALVFKINEFLCEKMGALRSNGSYRGQESMSWLPLRVPSEDGPAYAFGANQLTELAVRREKLELEGSWYIMTELLKKLQKACESGGAWLIIAYAPSKARVVFPLAAEHLDADRVRDYMRFKKDPLDLPEGKALISELLARFPVQETLVREWCERRSIPFVSLTQPLCDDAAQGRQVYYTYDQHWTALGHETAARQILADLNKSLNMASAPQN
ncbi:MAG TPA: hypothetical protein VJZ71_09560 [Phycisphaerae bacterium]|nr:hypothetical protein [Phycisphaerae bacterium]